MNSGLKQIDMAIERIGRLRAGLLADRSAENRAERLASLFESEARVWSQLFEIARLRPVWRAALVAEQEARREAACWRRRAVAEQRRRSGSIPLEMAG
jgi:hypothetical protein